MKNYNEVMEIAIRLARGQTLNKSEIKYPFKDLDYCLRALKNNCNAVLRQIREDINP